MNYRIFSDILRNNVEFSCEQTACFRAIPYHHIDHVLFYPEDNRGLPLLKKQQKKTHMKLSNDKNAIKNHHLSEPWCNAIGNTANFPLLYRNALFFAGIDSANSTEKGTYLSEMEDFIYTVKRIDLCNELDEAIPSIKNFTVYDQELDERKKCAIALFLSLQYLAAGNDFNKDLKREINNFFSEITETETKKEWQKLRELAKSCSVVTEFFRQRASTANKVPADFVNNINNKTTLRDMLGEIFFREFLNAYRENFSWSSELTNLQKQMVKIFYFANKQRVSPDLLRKIFESERIEYTDELEDLISKCILNPPKNNFLPYDNFFTADYFHISALYGLIVSDGIANSYASNEELITVLCELYSCCDGMNKQQLADLLVAMLGGIDFNGAESYRAVYAGEILRHSRSNLSAPLRIQLTEWAKEIENRLCGPENNESERNGS